MIYCTKCGKRNSDVAKFCTGCGSELNAVITDLPSRKKKRNWLALTTVIIIIALVGVYFIFFNSNSGRDNTQKDRYVSDAVAAKLKAIVNQWNDALNNKDVDQVTSLFSERIVYYRSSMSKENAGLTLNNFFFNNPGYYQLITSEIRFEKLSDNLINCNFNKSVTLKGKTTDYPSYLKFSEQAGSWRIVEEGDKITDYNINKKK